MNSTNEWISNYTVQVGENLVCFDTYTEENKNYIFNFFLILNLSFPVTGLRGKSGLHYINARLSSILAYHKEIFMD